VTLYGKDASVIRATVHEERIDLWNGMASSPVAVTLRDRRNYADLTGAARLRWIVRTNTIHPLYPIVRLADGQFIIGDRGITTYGEFLTVEIAFIGMRWYALDPDRIVVLTEISSPDLSRVDEVGLAMLARAADTGSRDLPIFQRWICSLTRCRVRPLFRLPRSLASAVHRS